MSFCSHLLYVLLNVILQWFAKISDILNSCNFSNLWNDQNQYTTKQYLKSTIFETLDSLEQSKRLNNVQTNQTCFFINVSIHLSF